jgi:arabinofuranosyltransferase
VASRYDLLLLAAAAVPLVILAAAIWRHRWITDDAFINLRIVRNILDGHGPVFNPGERVEAATSPLWIGLLALLGALGVRLESAAVYGSMALAVAGTALAQWGALLLAGGRRPLEALRHGLVLPLGALVVAVLPPFWDFGSSGLETGLIMAWLGLAFFLLARAVAGEGAGNPDAPPAAPGSGRFRPWYAAAFAAGLGPLVRPELGLVAVGFLVVAAAGFARASRAAGGRRVRAWALLIVSAAAAPLAYQVFRMGYYAALVPNTALAKEAFAARWLQGRLYAADFFGRYELALPLGALAVLWAAGVWRFWAGRDRLRVMLAITPALCGALHVLYVVRLGGDFMHARMFIPPLFACLLPVMMVPAASRDAPREALALRIPLALIVLGWVAVCSLFYRPPPAEQNGIGDERAWYIRNAVTAHPVAMEHYGNFYFRTEGARLARVARDNCPLAVRPGRPAGDAACRRVLHIDRPLGPALSPAPGTYPLASGFDPVVRLVTARDWIGLAGYAAGPEVFVVDRVGLADPLAARLALSQRGRPGHEKLLADSWVVARFTDPVPGEDAAVTAARHALGCGGLAELREATTAPLTAGRFLENLASAWRLHRLRIPDDPFEAESALCGTPRLFRESQGGTGGWAFRWQCPAGFLPVRLSGAVNAAERSLASLELRCDVRGGAAGGRSPGPPSAGSPRFGAAGGALQHVECPAGSIPVGVHGRVDRLVRRAGFLCGAPAWPGGGAQAPGASTTRGATFGTNEGREFSVRCPPGSVVVGLVGRGGSLVDALGVVCRPFGEFAEAPAGAP